MFASDKDPCKHRDKEIRAVIDDIILPAPLAQFIKHKLLSELSKLNAANFLFKKFLHKDLVQVQRITWTYLDFVF
jgi:hypothetical protein